MRTCKQLLHISLLVATPHKCRAVMQNILPINMTIKIVIIFCLLTFLVHDVYSQNIEEFFKAIPGGYVNNLTVEEREELMKKNKFYPSDNDENFIQIYRVVESTNDFLRIEMSFETGQRGFNTFQLKKWTLNTGDYLFGISRVAGTPGEFVQADLSFFTFNGDTLIKAQTNIPADLTVVDFAKPNTPDQLLQEYAQYISLTISFYEEKNDIFWRIHENMGGSNLDTSWLEGNAIQYIWNGKDFVKNGYIQYP